MKYAVINSTVEGDMVYASVRLEVVNLSSGSVRDLTVSTDDLSVRDLPELLAAGEIAEGEVYAQTISLAYDRRHFETNGPVLWHLRYRGAQSRDVVVSGVRAESF